MTPPADAPAQPTIVMNQPPAQTQSSSDWLTGGAPAPAPAISNESTMVLSPEQMAHLQALASGSTQVPAAQDVPSIDQMSPILQPPPPPAPKVSAESLLSQMAGASKDELLLKQMADSVVASTAMLPENIRMQVVQSMQDIQRYINHGLLTPATEECLRVIEKAPQYLDIHQVLCEIYVRQGKVEQAITKYAILIDTYTANGRIDDAIATYRRILQLEPNNLTYRMRLINLFSLQCNKEEQLR